MKNYDLIVNNKEVKFTCQEESIFDDVSFKKFGLKPPPTYKNRISKSSIIWKKVCSDNVEAISLASEISEFVRNFEIKTKFANIDCKMFNVDFFLSGNKLTIQFNKFLEELRGEGLLGRYSFEKKFCDIESEECLEFDRDKDIFYLPGYSGDTLESYHEYKNPEEAKEYAKYFYNILLKFSKDRDVISKYIPVSFSSIKIGEMFKYPDKEGENKYLKISKNEYFDFQNLAVVFETNLKEKCRKINFNVEV